MFCNHDFVQKTCLYKSNKNAFQNGFKGETPMIKVVKDNILEILTY